MNILLAVSGGIDSMYMANRASELFPGARFAIAHCNFGLRGSESDADEVFVREWSERQGLVFHSIRFDTGSVAAERHISTEMAARDLRYGWFRTLCAEYGYDAVAVAHNANDNAETMILNLLRGTGTRGLRGMSSNGHVLRPLLDTTREEIECWMRKNGKEWRDDRTNAESIYKRNIVRNEVFPIFRRMNPSFIQTLNADAGRIALADDIADEYFENCKSAVLSPEGNILIAELLELKHWEYVLWRLLEKTGTGADEFRNLTESLKSGRQIAGKKFGPVTAASGRLVIRNSVTRKLIIEEISIEDLKSLKQKEGVIIADADKIGKNPVIRQWQPGDWMQPFGMRGKKKLSDLFTDLKWSVTDKKNAQVIELDGSHVAAVLCCRIDEAVKVGKDTRRILRFSYSIT